jgi:hypothetical protein
MRARAYEPHRLAPVGRTEGLTAIYSLRTSREPAIHMRHTRSRGPRGNRAVGKAICAQDALGTTESPVQSLKLRKERIMNSLTPVVVVSA